MRIDSARITSVREARLIIQEILWPRTQKSVRCPYQQVSVTSRLILKKIYELFVGENETVRIKRVSVDQGSTVMLSSSTL